MDVLIDVAGLTKRFGPLAAVDDVTFTVARGEVLGFLGPNGAGKSTTMKMITGFLPPSAGKVAVCGLDVAAQPIQVKRRIGYLPEGAPLYGDMTPRDLLGFLAEVRGYGGQERRRRVDEAVAKLNIEGVLYQPIETLSKGYKRRVGLAQALLHDPDVLILDEPTDGLDPNQKHEVRTLLAEMAGDKAIIISTHILEEVDAVCSRAIIIARGRIVVDETPAELRARSDYHHAVRVVLKSEQAPGAQQELERLGSVGRVEADSQLDGRTALLALSEAGRDISDEVRATLAKASVPYDELRIESGHLDDVFRRITLAG